VAQLGAALAESMALPEVRQRFIDAGATPKVEGPESISRRLDTEVARWAPFISSLKKQ
jgi:tripartite-type tricarboxylate transporter receptor subunit TctC